MTSSTPIDEDVLDLVLEPAPQASVDDGQFRITWANAGIAIALDPASATLLDCFEGGLSPRELAADMTEALDLEADEAVSTMAALASSLIKSGHLQLRDEPARKRFIASYPPFASA